MVHTGKESISILCSLYISIVDSCVGLQIIFSVIVWPVSGFLTTLLLSSFNILVQPVNINKQISTNSIFFLFIYNPTFLNRFNNSCKILW